MLGLPPKSRCISETLAELVQMGGSDAEFYQEVVESLAVQKQREAERERNAMAIKRETYVRFMGPSFSD